MAKKTKVVDSCCAAPGSYKPTLYLDLEGKDVSQVKGLKVGDEGEFVIRGKIVGLEQSERTGEDGKSKTTGSIRLTEYEVDVMGEETNEFKELSKDD